MNFKLFSLLAVLLSAVAVSAQCKHWFKNEKGRPIGIQWAGVCSVAREVQNIKVKYINDDVYHGPIEIDCKDDKCTVMGIKNVSEKKKCFRFLSKNINVFCSGSVYDNYLRRSMCCYHKQLA